MTTDTEAKPKASSILSHQMSWTQNLRFYSSLKNGILNHPEIVLFVEFDIFWDILNQHLFFALTVEIIFMIMYEEVGRCSIYYGIELVSLKN